METLLRTSSFQHCQKNSRIQTKYRLLKFDILTHQNPMLCPTKPFYLVVFVFSIASTEQRYYRLLNNEILYLKFQSFKFQVNAGAQSFQ